MITFNRLDAERSIWSRLKKNADQICIEKRCIEVTGSDGAGISRLLVLLALQARCKNRPVLFMHDRWDMETRGALDFFGFGIGRAQAGLIELPKYKTGVWNTDFDCYLEEIAEARKFSEKNPDGLILVDKRVAWEAPPVNNALALAILENLGELFQGQIVSAGVCCEEGPEKALILGRSPAPWIPKSIDADWSIRERFSSMNTGEFLLLSEGQLIPVGIPDMILPGHISKLDGPYVRPARR